MNEINIFMDFSNPVFQLAIALLLGAFVGLRREFDLQKKGTTGFRGLRTTALVTVLGALSTIVSSSSMSPLIFFTVLSIFVGIAYYGGVAKDKIGLTSEISLILMFWSGVLIGKEEFVLAIVLAFIVAISDAYKEKMHSFASSINLKEWSGTLEMIIISLVVLPFLPKEAIDPWGILIPYDIWLLVVFVTGIGFVGYFLTKYFHSAKIKGIYLTSFLGSLVSSTAVTVQLSQKLKSDKSIFDYFIPAILLSIVVMQIRTLILVLFTIQEFTYELLIAPFLMTVVSIILFLIYVIKKKKNKREITIDVGDRSPFEILPSLKFATAFIFVLFAVYFIKEYFGDGGIYITTLIVATVDMEAIVLPVLESFRKGAFDLTLAANVVTIVAVINTLVKLVYIWLFAGKKYFYKILTPMILVISVGAISLFLF